MAQDPGAGGVRLRQAGLLLLGLVVTGAMVVLGVWQLDVYRAQGEEVAAARAAEPAVPLASVATAGAAVGDGYGRTVTFSGRYDPALQLLVRDPDGGPSRVLSGLVLADDSVLPVVRGTVPAATPTAPTPPPGAVTGSGVLLPSESAGQGSGPVDLPDPAELSAVQLAVVAQSWSPPLISGFATLTPAEATAQGLSPAAVALPESQGRLRNAAYALQWWVFAAFAFAMALRIVRDVGRAEDYAQLETAETDPADLPHL